MQQPLQIRRFKDDKTDQSFKAGEKDNLADEMADVLWVLTCLANQTGVDLEQAMERNFQKKTQRDKERHKLNPKL